MLAEPHLTAAHADGCLVCPSGKPYKHWKTKRCSTCTEVSGKYSTARHGTASINTSKQVLSHGLHHMQPARNQGSKLMICSACLVLDCRCRLPPVLHQRGLVRMAGEACYGSTCSCSRLGHPATSSWISSLALPHPAQPSPARGCLLGRTFSRVDCHHYCQTIAPSLHSKTCDTKRGYYKDTQNRCALCAIANCQTCGPTGACATCKKVCAFARAGRR